MPDITHTAYPSDFDKKDAEFFLKVAKALENQWYNGMLARRRMWINEMRSYSRGEQDTSQYKKTIEGERKGDSTKTGVKTHKIDYAPLKIMPTFKDILINAIDESLFKPRAEAIDITAINNKKEYFNKLENDFYTKDIADTISNAIGIDISPKAVAEDENDLAIKKLEYKPDIEIAQELAIENVLKLEKFEAIKDKVDEDLFDLGIGVIKHYTSASEGIKVEYVDPYNFVHNSFELDDGRDIRIAGEANKSGTIAEVAKQAGGLTKEQLLALKNVAIGDLNNTEEYSEAEDGHRLIEYLSFAYLTSDSKVYKKLRKNKITKLIDRTEDSEPYNPSNPNKKIEIIYQTWYEGVYVPKGQILLSYSKIENQVEEGVNKPMPPYLVYAPKVKRLSETGYVRFDSNIQRAKPIIDDIHRDWYKFQQLKMELRPNTTVINPRALENVTLNGQKIDGKDLLDMYFGRGVLLAEEIDEDGEPLGRAITEVGGGIQNSAIGFLSAEFANNYNRLRQFLGINELRDGTTQPNSKTAVTVQKLLLASSNNATNHIVKASFNLSLRVAESISLRLYDVLNSKILKERYMDIIGSDNVDLLDAIKKIPMHKFGIYFDFKPDNEERIAFEQSLINSYNQKEINVAQYNKARQIRNVKSAIKYLEHTIDSNIEKDQEMKLQNIQAQAQANAQTSVLTEKTKQETETVKYSIKKQELLLKDQIDSRAEIRKARLRELEKSKDHERATELEILRTGAKRDIANQKEDRIDKRIDKTSTNQSKLIDQRNKDSEPIEFEDQLSDIFKENPLLNN